jgi:SAM-dependent methyltransferase
VSQAERDKWDERYRGGAYEDRTHPTALLAEWIDRLPRGHALDVACGAGRNALFLAAHGYSVDAVDISAVALERGRADAQRLGLDVRWLCLDLDDGAEDGLPPGPYELVVWVRYVNAALLPRLARRLAPGGLALCEQHLVTAAEVAGPQTASFRLRPGALLSEAGRVAALEIVEYREGLVADPDGRTVALAQLIARSTA